MISEPKDPNPRVPETIREPGQEYFFEQGFEKAHTVVFFLDVARGRLGMLKRDASNAFAPNMHTGVGGKIELHEGHVQGAVRELNEELVLGERPIVQERVKEFGRIIINKKRVISYFVSPYEQDVLPPTSPRIGELKWVSFEDLEKCDVIPTTKYFMDEWKKRAWNTDAPFTVLLNRKDADDIRSEIESMETREGFISHALS